MRHKYYTYLLPLIAAPLLCTGCHPKLSYGQENPLLYKTLPQELAYIHDQHIAVLKLEHTLRFIIPSDLFFQGTSTTLQPYRTDVLEQVAAVASAYPDATIYITGYNDNVLNQQAAQAQSLAEAQAIAGFLWNDGLSSKHTVVTGHAYQTPINSLNSPKAGAENRRVELFISPTD